MVFWGMNDMAAKICKETNDFYYLLLGKQAPVIATWWSGLRNICFVMPKENT